MNSKPFSASLKTYAWNLLQAAIADQLKKTPGTYDSPALVDVIAHKVGAQNKVAYKKIADYLEAREAEYTDGEVPV